MIYCHPPKKCCEKYTNLRWLQIWMVALKLCSVQHTQHPSNGYMRWTYHQITSTVSVQVRDTYQGLKDPALWVQNMLYWRDDDWAQFRLTFSILVCFCLNTKKRWVSDRCRTEQRRILEGRGSIGKKVDKCGRKISFHYENVIFFRIKKEPFSSSPFSSITSLNLLVTTP